GARDRRDPQGCRRRRRDSNPWYSCPYGGFQNRCLRPLGHSSKYPERLRFSLLSAVGPHLRRRTEAYPVGSPAPPPYIGQPRGTGARAPFANALDPLRAALDPLRVARDPRRVALDPRRVARDPRRVARDPRRVARDPRRV